MTWNVAKLSVSPRPPGHGGHRLNLIQRGFTLVESLMACGILLVIVVAVTSAVTAGQQHAYHAQQRIAATLAAEEWMGRLEVLGFNQLLPMHQVEQVGEMADAKGDPFPPSFRGVGREAWVTFTHIVTPHPQVQINGKTIRVRAFDASGRTLADISRYIVEPRGETLPDGVPDIGPDPYGGMFDLLGGRAGGTGAR